MTSGDDQVHTEYVIEPELDHLHINSTNITVDMQDSRTKEAQTSAKAQDAG
jgi:hypothetical protein